MCFVWGKILTLFINSLFRILILWQLVFGSDSKTVSNETFSLVHSSSWIFGLVQIVSVTPSLLKQFCPCSICLTHLKCRFFHPLMDHSLPVNQAVVRILGLYELSVCLIVMENSFLVCLEFCARSIVLLFRIVYFFTPWWPILSRLVQAVVRILGLCIFFLIAVHYQFYFMAGNFFKSY